MHLVGFIIRTITSLNMTGGVDARARGCVRVCVCVCVEKQRIFCGL